MIYFSTGLPGSKLVIEGREVTIGESMVVAHRKPSSYSDEGVVTTSSEQYVHTDDRTNAILLTAGLALGYHIFSKE